MTKRLTYPSEAASRSSGDLVIIKRHIAGFVLMGLLGALPVSAGERTANAGIRLPNHGQDFATLTFRLNSDLVGVPSADVIPLAAVALASATGGSRGGWDDGLLP